MKDYLSSTKYESNTIVESHASPSHMNMRNHILNQNSSGNLPEDVYSEPKTGKRQVARMYNSKGAAIKSQSQTRRPKTGNVNNGRN